MKVISEIVMFIVRTAVASMYPELWFHGYQNRVDMGADWKELALFWAQVPLLANAFLIFGWWARIIIEVIYLTQGG